jgi:hypothetical protein
MVTLPRNKGLKEEGQVLVEAPVWDTGISVSQKVAQGLQAPVEGACPISCGNCRRKVASPAPLAKTWTLGRKPPIKPHCESKG